MRRVSPRCGRGEILKYLFERKNHMKKYLALLLVAALSLTALLGLAPIASAAGSATPSQEIDYFNVSIKVGAKLLFAVPAEGYTVNTDGTVDNLQLLVWEDGKSNGAYSRLDAEKNGTILEAEGTEMIGGKKYVIFTYSGLAASQMFESVYARTLYTNDVGFRSYSHVYEYSIAEFANAYLNKSGVEHVDLVEALIEYGYHANLFAAGTKYESSAEALTLAEVKNSPKVTVEYKLNGNLIGTDSQLVKNGGDTTLKAPIVLEANGAAPVWSENAPAGVVNTKENITVTADYTSFSTVTDNNTSADGLTNAVGSYVSVSNPNNPTNHSTNANVVAPAGQSGTYKINIGSSYNLGNNFNYIKDGVSAPLHAYSQAKITIAGDAKNQYVKFSHNGAGEIKFSPAFVASKSATGVGDTMSFSFSVDLMSGKDGTFPYSTFRIDRHGSSTHASDGEPAKKSPIIFALNADGSVTLEGKSVVNYNGINTKVIAESISQTEFQRITVVVDYARGLYLGYLDGELKAVTTLHKDFNATEFLAGIEALKATRQQVVLYGGYQAGNWKNSASVLNAAKAATVDLGGVETNVYDAETGTWNHAALEKYVDDNYYFYFDNATVSYGALYND